jgi:aminobenzoyl-glutamate utilization protein B
MNKRLFRLSCIIVLSVSTLSLSPTGIVTAAQSYDRSEVLQKVDSRAQHFGELSRQIWEFAEVGYKETKSSALLISELRGAGFQIRDNIAGIPTAFTATWGQGKPVIGIMGEYDALPGLSQEEIPEKRPRAAGSRGHGCGHNLLGVGAALATVTVKEFLTQKRMPGTIRFYGTPAEEGGGAKVYMVRAGAFQDCDVVLTWHPGSSNRAGLRSSLANISAKFRFHGKAAHAAGSPEAGRSALDAVMVMTHAVDLMREHVPESTRIHYVITNGGGAPNVVPDFAEVYFYARHPEMPVLDGIWARILKCAEAGALATETRMEMELINSVYNVLPNDTLAALLGGNLKRAGGVRYSPEEQKFAETLLKTYAPNADLPLGSQEQVQTPDEGYDSGSTDVGDVSWAVPTAQFYAATYVPGTPAHSWQSTACSGMSIGRKGMVVAAKTLALTAIDLFADPNHITGARASFDKRRSGVEYRSRLPADQKPPLNYRDR